MSDCLEGWAYPIQGATIDGYSIADHAYVKAPNNGPAYFDCWGGHEGTDEYPVFGASGDGDFAVANCCRGPDICGHKDNAYVLEYGVDGVCHQSANRFLYSACHSVGRQIVVTDPNHGVHGGIVSVFVYGVYGRSSAEFFKTIYTRCELPIPEHPIAPNNSNPSGYHEELGALILDRALSVLQGNIPKPPDLINQISSEFEILVKHSIGGEFVTDELAALHTALLSDKDDLKAGSKSGGDFANRLNDRINVCLLDMAKYLGVDQYEKLFGLTYAKPLILVIPEIAEAAWQYKP